MTKSKPTSDAKGRRDHYVPQGYLRGFIHPQRQGHPNPLWVLDVSRGKWSEKSPSRIGWEPIRTLLLRYFKKSAAAPTNLISSA